jgi:DNA invertase Pin-like site-specific DNA recombinase
VGTPTEEGKVLIPYIRRSRKDEEVVSIEDQLAAVLEWGRRNEVELAKPVLERGVSGHDSWRERELGEIIERCKRGEAEGVVVAYFSRLTREKNSATWDVLEELTPFRLVSVREGIDSKPGVEPDWNQAIQGFQANTEYKTLARHLKSGKHAAWERGSYVSTWLPVGYTGSPLRKNEHADAVVRAFHVRAGGGTWTEVARALTAAGVPNRSGKPWSTSAAAKLMLNPIYKGTLRCTCGCGKERFDKELAIVSPGVWDKAQERATRKLGRPAGSGGGLLSGLIRCTCGSAMSLSKDSRGYRRYRCRGGDACPARAAVSTDLIDKFVGEQVFELFVQRGAVVGREPDVEKLAELENAEAAADAWLREVVGLLEPGDPGAAEKLTSARAARDNAAALALAERESQVREVSPEEWRAAWAVSQQTGDVEGPRRLMRDWLDGVIVTKGTARNQPVEERVEFLYKK